MTTCTLLDRKKEACGTLMVLLGYTRRKHLAVYACPKCDCPEKKV